MWLRRKDARPALQQLKEELANLHSWEFGRSAWCLSPRKPFLVPYWLSLGVRNWYGLPIMFSLDAHRSWIRIRARVSVSERAAWNSFSYHIPKYADMDAYLAGRLVASNAVRRDLS